MKKRFIQGLTFQNGVKLLRSLTISIAILSLLSSCHILRKMRSSSQPEWEKTCHDAITRVAKHLKQDPNCVNKCKQYVSTFCEERCTRHKLEETKNWREARRQCISELSLYLNEDCINACSSAPDEMPEGGLYPYKRGCVCPPASQVSPGSGLPPLAEDDLTIDDSHFNF